MVCFSSRVSCRTNYVLVTYAEDLALGVRCPFIKGVFNEERSIGKRDGRGVRPGGFHVVERDAQAQKTKGKTRAALTKQLMKGIVAANCGELKKALDADAPNWEDISLRAAVLNEAGYFLMEDGRCPDADWANAAKALQADSAAVLAAAEKMDAAAAKAAFGKLTAEGCGGLPQGPQKVTACNELSRRGCGTRFVRELTMSRLG